MSTAVKAFLVGFVLFVVVGCAGALALGILADLNGWSSFRIGAGPVTAFEFERTAGTTSTTFGAGLLLFAALLAAAKAGGADVLQRRRGPSRA